jgi:hypothetical protein
MKVVIEERKILIEGKTLEYYPYYFSCWKDISDHRLTVKNVLAQWAAALSRLSIKAHVVYLPYYLDDQTCKYLKAELDGHDVLFTDLLVNANAYSMDLDDLSFEMYSEPQVIESWVDINGNKHDTAPQFFARFNLRDVIDALNTAELGNA